MALTQTDLDALDAARKQGARRVRFQDREFEFDSVDDYLKLRNLILNDIAQQSGPQQVRQVRCSLHFAGPPREIGLCRK
jgi:hypothetical protein